ncbi:Lateral flagellin (plasmid) [Vibrio breoganii]|uniref:Flagellin n=1 Tax=Vibrio breoganii TaxID=553239 RepID=A0AAN1CU41_9VIBR|nr:flagellin [Vibrio breoganii]ANO35313.1 Lateral flagellin [Vibrio breoganii]PML12765.1 Lateral flagellin [Vibrio breoganii]
MTIGVNTNYAALITQNQLASTNKALTDSMQKLSTGNRISSAKDDAAGLQIASRLEAQSRGMEVASRNAQDAVSFLQVAEGALDEVSSILYRMNDLALQASNGTNGANDQAALNQEFASLSEEMANILENSNYGGNNLFGAGGAISGGTIDFQIGSTTAETLTFDVTNGGTSTALGDLLTFVGTPGATGTGDITDAANAQAAVDAISGAGGVLENVGEVRATFGATVNRLEHVTGNLANMQEGVTMAKSRIMDTDFSKESMEMSKQQMLMQSASQMLNTSKMVPQLAMSLIG